MVVTINTPIPGSQQYAEAQQYGTLDETDWSKFNYWCPVFVPRGLTQEILLAKQQEFYRRFYLRPRILWRYGLSFLVAHRTAAILVALANAAVSVARSTVRSRPGGSST